MSTDDDIDESSNMKKSRPSMDEDGKLELSVLQSLFADAGISEEKTECPFKSSVNHFHILFQIFLLINKCE